MAIVDGDVHISLSCPRCVQWGKGLYDQQNEIDNNTPCTFMGQLHDVCANYGMCFSVLINRPEIVLQGCLCSKPMFSLIADININISGSPTFFEEYIYKCQTANCIITPDMITFIACVTLIVTEVSKIRLLQFFVN